MTSSTSLKKSAPVVLAFHDFQPEKAVLCASLSGTLDVHGAGKVWREVLARMRSFSPRALRLEVSGLEYVDSSGLVLFAELEQHLLKAGASLELIGLREDYARSLHQFTELVRPIPGAGRRPGLLERIGGFALVLYHDVRDLVGFVGSFTVAFAQALRHPRTIRWRDVWLNCEAVGANAVLIIALIGFLMGLIISFQSAMPLRMFGAEIYVARLLGLSMLRELGPLVTAIILAGRSGASFAAELGTMKINEELNALHTMGLDPVRFLVVPRMLAAMLMTPLLTLLFNLFSLIGGGVVMLSLGYPLVTYINQVTMSVAMGDLLNGLFKAFVFSILVGWIGCVRGLQTGKGAWAVGASTTSAVVSGIIMIAVMDGIFAVFFYVFNY
ncbi:MAG TPA: STAS domain-containing protein [Desulfonatronum sp.]|nr:STAS domain-containing protein [Desulfonatronum sp.]